MAAFERVMPRVLGVANAIEDALAPVAFLTTREEGALRRYLNAAQLESAEKMGGGVVSDSAEADALVEAGAMVQLQDSTTWWVLQPMGYSMPVVTPDTHTLLEEIGRRFHARLDSLGVPPLRFEVSSGLRTAATQAALRRRNANATRGTSTHEYGTTVDVSYSAFSAPAEPLVLMTGDDAWLQAPVHGLSSFAVDAAAARKSRELQAILGRVLREMQDEGAVMVTLERGQPVFHMTVAAELADR